MDDTFNYETTVQVRFRDLDVMGQVHNAVLLSYVEEARVRYFRDVLDVALAETNGAIARQTIDYHAPIDLGTAVTVRYRVADIGDSSLTMAFEVRTDHDHEARGGDDELAASGGDDELLASGRQDELAASGEVVHVVLDEDGEPCTVPAGWAERIREFEAAGS